MAEIIVRTTIKREPGFLYFVKSDSNGNLMMGKAPMTRGGRKGRKKGAKNK